MDFQTEKVLDDRLMISDKITYGVLKGGENVTSATFAAISQANNQHTYNIQVPSLNTICDRRVLWKSKVTLKVTGVVAAPVNSVDKYILDYGVKDALGAFPLHQLATVMSATINNTSVSVNVRDVIAPLLRVHNRRELSLYNGTTPTAPDNCQKYEDFVGSVANVLGGYNNVTDNNLIPRGAFNVVIGSSISTGVPTGALVAGDGTAVQTAYIQFESAEPLLFLSPFTYATVDGAPGLAGIQNLNFNFNMGDASRVLRSALTDMVGGTGKKTVTVEKYENSELQFMFLSPHASEIIPARNVVPYVEVPRYLQSNFGARASLEEFTFRSSSITLNQVPDKLIVGIRRISDATYTVDGNAPDAFLPISGVSINFNNQSGILSSATPYQLWAMGNENGANLSWLEHSGACNFGSSQTGANAGKGKIVPTCGSVLVLEFGKDINLTQDYLAAGSLGNFLLQMNVTAKNTYSTAASFEMFIITVNSGLFVSERGTSSLYTGILTKQDVISASEQSAVSYSKAFRMVGGSVLDRLKSALKTGANVANVLVKHSGAPAEMMKAISGKGRLSQRLM
jgi:hypothetical protein